MLTMSLLLSFGVPSNRWRGFIQLGVSQRCRTHMELCVIFCLSGSGLLLAVYQAATCASLTLPSTIKFPYPLSLGLYGQSIHSSVFADIISLSVANLRLLLRLLIFCLLPSGVACSNMDYDICGSDMCLVVSSVIFLATHDHNVSTPVSGHRNF